MSLPPQDAARVPDRRGCLVTTTDADAVSALDDAVWATVHHRADAGAHVARALELDPHLTTAHCMVGFGAKLLGRSDLAPAAAKSAARARASLSQRGGTAREELLVRALELWCGRDPDGAIHALHAAQEAEPLDLLAMKVGHALAFLLGRTRLMQASLERVLPAWETTGTDGLGSVLGCYAFTIHELGDVERAERIGRRAVAMDPRDPWAVHAVAHALLSGARPEEGLEWLGAQRRCLEGANNFGGHIHWHRALFLLALDRREEALAIHDTHVVDQPPGDYRDLVNSATLLFRLERVGVDVGARWERLAAVAESRLGDHASAFADTHHVLVLGASGRRAIAERFIVSMHERASAIEGTEATTSLEVGLPVARAMLHLRSDPALACELLVRHAEDLARLGGSHAQREIYGLALADALAGRAREEASAAA